MMDEKIATRFRELLSQKLPWRTTTSARYKNCPHEYIVRDWCRTEWDEMATLVKEYGKRRRWRAANIVFLSFDGMIYWVDSPALNRTLKCALENGGYPTKETQTRIQTKMS